MSKDKTASKEYEIVIPFTLHAGNGRGRAEEIHLYGYAAELYEELQQIGAIDRLQRIPQLGTIKVDKKFRKSRYEYVFLQLYLHQLINVGLKGKLDLSYSSVLAADDFGEGFKYPNGSSKATILNIIQILTIVYNIGHFYNTFASSKAMQLLIEDHPEYRELLSAAQDDDGQQKAFDQIIEEENYLRFHLVNSLLMLDRCNSEKVSVKMAKEIIKAYLAPAEFVPGEKLKFAFTVFREVRNVSYMIYDLPIARLPFVIDLDNKQDILQLFYELLGSYNNNEPSRRLEYSLMKLLDDVLYNSDKEALRQHLIARRIERKVDTVVREDRTMDYYNCLFLDNKSPLNDPKMTRKPGEFDENGMILKLTFKANERQSAKKLLHKLERTNGVNAGSYRRVNGDVTVLAALKKNCDAHVKTAFRILQITVSVLRNCPTIDSGDDRYLLTAKFFLYYLLGERKIDIKSTISEHTCVICTSGRKKRMKAVDAVLSEGLGNQNERHEVEFLRKVLESDTKNDVSILVTASIVLYETGTANSSKAEFDGMILYPMRKEKQVIFLEAKHTKRQPLFGKKCLGDRLAKLGIHYNEEEILVDRHDAWLSYSI